jgi:hypothetical protein
MIDNTMNPLIAFTGSGAAGFFMGMFVRRVLKFLVIIIGSFLSKPCNPGSDLGSVQRQALQTTTCTTLVYSKGSLHSNYS